MYAAALGVAFLVTLGSTLSIPAAANATDCVDNLGETPTAAQIIACMGQLETELAAVTSKNNELRGQLDAMQQQAKQPMPRGAVVAFDLPDGCPEGWDEFGDAAGRTIIGAGSGMTDQNNQPLSGRKYREHGGEEQQTLTKEEMPNHHHVIPHKGADFAIQSLSQGTSLGVTRTIGKEDTTNEGAGRPHNNMPPYIALYFCKYEGTG